MLNGESTQERSIVNAAEAFEDEQILGSSVEENMDDQVSAGIGPKAPWERRAIERKPSVSIRSSLPESPALS